MKLKVQPVLKRILRRIARHVSVRVMSPVTLAVSVTSFFLMAFIPLLLYQKTRFQSGGSLAVAEQVRQISEVRKGLFPINLLPLSRGADPSSGNNNDSLHRQSHNTSFLRSPDGRFYLTVIPQGRLGNQMFEYASLLGIADVNNRVPFVTSSCVVTHYFVNASVSDRPVSAWTTVKELNYAEKDDIFDSLPERNVRIRGFLQSWRYFSTVTEKVRNAFHFVPDVREAVHKFYVNATKNVTTDVIKIGVHVRRTDMQRKFAHKQGYLTAPLSYLQKAIDHMKSRFKDRSILFLVVSDDRDWCFENMKGFGVRVVDSAPYVVHLGFLALCDHVIMTVGTFGWWGAFLSRGHVVYYGGYPRNGSDIALGFDKDDFYPPHWVAIGD